MDKLRLLELFEDILYCFYGKTIQEEWASVERRIAAEIKAIHKELVK